ncbi:MAG: DUF4342 domain-containing protein [Candidatus Altimarinota bacterium]
MSKNKSTKDELVNSFKIQGEDLLKEIKKLIHEGNVRKIVIKDEKGEKTYLEIPVTFGVIGTVLLPVLAAVGALAAMVGLVVVEIVSDNAMAKKPTSASKTPAKAKKAPATAKKSPVKAKKSKSSGRK